MEVEKFELDCPSPDIAAYIDGELSGDREFELDIHFAGCKVCTNELNDQKHFLNGLDFGLREEKELDLPSNFIKLVVTNAESNVSGLRRPNERFNALFVIVAVALFVLFALGSEASRSFAEVSGFFDQFLAVSGFFGHLIYSIFLGLAIVLRSLALQVSVDTAMSTALFMVFLPVVFLAARKMLRSFRF